MLAEKQLFFSQNQCTFGFFFFFLLTSVVFVLLCFGVRQTIEKRKERGLDVGCALVVEGKDPKQKKKKKKKEQKNSVGWENKKR